MIHGHTDYFYQNAKLFNLKPRTLSASNNWPIKKGVHDHFCFSTTRSYGRSDEGGCEVKEEREEGPPEGEVRVTGGAGDGRRVQSEGGSRRVKEVGYIKMKGK